MFRIVHLPDHIDDLVLALIRHKTWITVDGRQYESRLLNQYDLAEVIEGAHKALTPEQRRRAYRRWLWQEMQHEHGVVRRELCDLAAAPTQVL